MGRAVWSAAPKCSVATYGVDPGQMHVHDFAEILKARRVPQSHTLSATARFDLDRHAAASGRRLEATKTVDAVFTKICAEEEESFLDSS